MKALDRVLDANKQTLVSMRLETKWFDVWPFGDHSFLWHSDDEAVVAIKGATSLVETVSWVARVVGTMGYAPSIEVYQPVDVLNFMVRRQKNSLHRLLQRRVGAGHPVPTGTRLFLLTESLTTMSGGRSTYGVLDAVPMSRLLSLDDLVR